MTFEVTYYVFTLDVEHCRFNLKLDDAISYYKQLNKYTQYKAIGVHLEPTSSVDVLITEDGNNNRVSEDYLKSPNTKNNLIVLELIQVLRKEFIV